MKKKLILALVLSIAVTMTVPGIAFAADTATTPAAINSATIAISETPISISYDDACKTILASSPQARQNEIDYKNDLATAKGSSEKIQSMNAAEASITAGLAGNATQAAIAQSMSFKLDTSSKATFKVMRQFATSQAPKNKEARETALKSSILGTYYELKLAEASAQIKKEGLDLYNDILKNTRLKFSVGSASKMDVLIAEVQANTAKAEYTAATNSLANKYMSFNILMGNNILQKINLTTEMTETVLPTTTLDASIKQALTVSNDIAYAKYLLDISQRAFNDVKAYPRNSSTYMSAEADFLSAQDSYNNAPAQIEMNVRSKYSNMMEKYEAVNLGKASVASADETIRLASLQYNAGFISLTDMNEKALTAYQTKLGYQKTLLEYAMAVDAYNALNGVGTTVAKF